MGEIDYIILGISIEEKAIFNMGDLYKVMKKWFLNNKYDFIEKEYIDIEKKDIAIKWVAEKKVDDYTKFAIEVRIKTKGLKSVEIKNKKSNKGRITVKYESYLEKDYEDNWESNPMSKFLRSIYDKFILKSKFEGYSKELKEETYAVFNETKTYLGLHKF